ncbi:MAG TPA: hypothetical protein VF979_02590 [Streptosporangiaceae bacterium]
MPAWVAAAGPAPRRRRAGLLAGGRRRMREDGDFDGFYAANYGRTAPS